MRLRGVSYKEFEGRDQEWILDHLELRTSNLLVGKNAVGKSRCLNLIGGLANILAGRQPPTLLSADYTVDFQDGDHRLTYHFRSEDELIQSERFTVNGNVLLERGAGGEGVIFATELENTIKFQTPQNELAAVARRDAIQHPFLQPLYDWGTAVRHYHFGTFLGKDRYAVFLPQREPPVDEPDDTDASRVVAIFKKAMKELGEQEFRQAVLRDLALVDYPASDVGIDRPVSIRVKDVLPGELMGLYVKEQGLKAITDQHTMSQGMFRVLSLLTLANYVTMARKAACLIIDDVGEGLDFERSCALVEVLRSKAEESRLQLIMATNDKFVMNRVPLEEWSVLQRKGSHLTVLNNDNSRDLFEEFRFTGLSNFSFLELDFANAPPTEEPVAHE